MRKYLLTLLLCSPLFLSLPSFRTAPPQKQLRTLVIDAGHGIRAGGGYDGARGSYSYEDQICLAVSKALIDTLRKRHPEIRIVETRPQPDYIGIHERANHANAEKGDLFISIHVNAAPERTVREQTGTKKVPYTVGKGKKKKTLYREQAVYRTYKVPNAAKGTETYIWGADKAADKSVSMRENAPMFNEEGWEEKYGKIDPNSPEFYALAQLKTKQFFKRSATFAGLIEDEFYDVGRSSRGEKQRGKGIWVLQATAMPSVLIETGYITNREEEDYLNSKAGQAQLASCISKAIGNYIAWLDRQSLPATANTFGKLPTLRQAQDTHRFLTGIDEAERIRNHGK